MQWCIYHYNIMGLLSSFVSITEPLICANWYLQCHKHNVMHAYPSWSHHEITLSVTTSYLYIYMLTLPPCRCPRGNKFQPALQSHKSWQQPDPITCEIDGVPTPDIQWVHNGAIVSPGPAMTIITFNGLSSFTQENFQRNHTGVYECNASSSVGSTRKQFTVQIEGNGLPIRCNPHSMQLYRHELLQWYID